MTPEEITLHRLAGQHLLAPADTQTVVKDLCGVQAQYLSHGLHGLRIRCGEVRTEGLIKSWTNRGTMHLFSEDDLPLFLHEGRSHFLRKADTLETDDYISAARKAYFADLILDSISQGIDERDALKSVCIQAGMTESESRSLFDPWGGVIRALCEAGQICHKVQEKKAYRLCPAFDPMDEASARQELIRRYFAHFGPATIRDAACFFGATQANVKVWMKQLPLSEVSLGTRTYFFLDTGNPRCELPGCLFLAGFDQLMLGYEKTESLILPGEHLRDIYTRAGIVRPPVLVNGMAAGWWNLKNRVLKITLFSPADRKMISDAAAGLWSNLKRIEYT